MDGTFSSGIGVCSNEEGSGIKSGEKADGEGKKVIQGRGENRRSDTNQQL